MRIQQLALITVTASLLAPGCGSTPTPRAEDVDVPRHVRWSPRIGQGAEPRTDADFRRLAAQGYRVVLSVDGALTNVEAAARHGLRYVHVPVRYDGIERAAALAIVKTVATAEGPVYIHCHHGKHRGPAAAALARIAVDGVVRSRALAGLMRTLSPSYPGLREAVERFVPPTGAQLARTQAAPAQVRPSSLVAHMLEVDDRWQHLSAAAQRRWRVDPNHPDLAPPHEARLLVEALTETGRLEAQTAAFTSQLQASTQAAKALETALVAGDLAAADRAVAQVRRSCTACHQAFRN